MLRESKKDENTDIHYLSQIWTAKEALYKAFREPGLNFSKQILIDPLEDNSKEGIGSIIFRNSVKKYKLYFRHFDGFCLSLATTKNNK